MALRNGCSMTVGQRIRLRELTASVKADLSRLDALWAEGLDRHGGPFLAGPRFTAVDAFFAPVATRVQTYDLPVAASSRPYVDRLLALPAVQEWIDAGIRETFRDEGHEQEARDAGEVLKDLLH